MLHIFWIGTQLEFTESPKYMCFYTNVKYRRSFSHHCLLSFGTFVVSERLVFLKQLFLFFHRGWGIVLSLVTMLQV